MPQLIKRLAADKKPPKWVVFCLFGFFVNHVCSSLSSLFILTERTEFFELESVFELWVLYCLVVGSLTSSTLEVCFAFL